MKTLLLLRHAKSSWTDPTLADRDRPLTGRGKRAAELIGRYAQAHRLSPGLVLCSPARRALDTLAIVRPRLGADVEIWTDDAIYSADADDVLNRLHAVREAVASVLVVGHNPALHDLARTLAGDGDQDALAQLQVKLPTCALAILDLGPAEWPELDAGRAYLADLVIPRHLEP